MLVLGLTLAFTACREEDRQDSPARGRESRTGVETTAPGEATLDFSGQRVKTTIKDVRTLKQAFAEDPFSKAATGKTYLRFEAEVENVGDEPNTIGGGYGLRLPEGDVLEYEGTADGDTALFFSEPIPPGTKRQGNLTWEIETPKKGAEFVLLWRPNPMGSEQARFVYKHGD